MIRDTLAKIEQKLEHVPSLSDETRTELLQLFNTLEEEISNLSHTQSDEAESITGFTQVSAHEATRDQPNPALLQLSLDGLAASAKDFEASHPKLAETVNSICHILSNMGI